MNFNRSWCIVCLLGCFVCSMNSLLGWAFSSRPSLQGTRSAGPIHSQHLMYSIGPRKDQTAATTESHQIGISPNSERSPSLLPPLPNRRSFLLLATVGVLLTTSTAAPASAAPILESPVDDPLVLFGERLSETAIPRGGKWPQGAAHPLPIRNDELDASASALEEALELSKRKKQINPTTHG
jgi:hypothetical protein